MKIDIVFDIVEQDVDSWQNHSGACVKRKPFVLKAMYDGRTYSRPFANEAYANEVAAKVRGGCKGKSIFFIKEALERWERIGRL